MIRKKAIITASVMCLAFTPVYASNLVRMDVAKASGNDVDVTFFTTENMSSPMVTRKSGNKYVVLMPHVEGQNAGTPDLSAVKDIISNVDVKHVDDGLGGYTKVTFITSKPINIKTHIQKTAPISAEEKEAKKLIAQTKTHPIQTTAPAPAKQEPVKTKITSSDTAKTSAKKVEPQKKEDKKLTLNKVVKPKTETPTVKEVPSQNQIPQSQNIEEKPKEQVTLPAPLVTEQKTQSISEIEKILKETKKPFKIPTGLLVVIIPLFALYLMIKTIKSSIQGSTQLKTSFKEHLNDQPQSAKNYDEIIENQELNWQEKYKKFLEESKGNIRTPKYSFITFNPKITATDKKRLELEKTLEKTPQIYEEQEIDIVEDTTPEVISEDDIIPKTANHIKLKAFANPISINKTERNKSVRRLPRVNPHKEGRFVKLYETPLTKGTRKFNNSNLRVSDLIKTGNRFLDNKDEEMFDKEQNYLMSSIDEYFSILDKEQSKKMTNPNRDLSNRVAASLAQVKPSMYVKKDRSTEHVSNPIAKSSDNSHLNGLVVKSGYSIDENRGFYLVSLDGVTALVGRIKEEIFVLKKFDRNVNKLQVRLDSENVYIVKADDYKMLVDVDTDKMGVLIEL